MKKKNSASATKIAKRRCAVGESCALGTQPGSRGREPSLLVNGSVTFCALPVHGAAMPWLKQSGEDHIFY